MFCSWTCTAILVVIISVILKFIYRATFCKKKTDQGYQEQWFGKDPSPLTDDDVKESVEDTAVHEFKIRVSDEVLNDLKKRLENTRFEEPILDAKFRYGFNSSYLRELVDYWKNQFQWRKQEEMLNKFPQFKTRIEGIDIHFLHVKPILPEGRRLKVLPLMVIHGWPGSFVEFYKLIPMLTTPRTECDYVFEVVCPSIPGFGFSESPHRRGFTSRAASRVFLTLMERLGHTKFYVQGGDWGAHVAANLARFYSPRVFGLHLNMFVAGLKPWELFKFFLGAYCPFIMKPEEHRLIYPLKEKFRRLYEETGYFHIQSTKPDTLGCAMSDSPAGLAAYLLEKFSIATNPEYLDRDDGGLTKKFTMDELLTNVMVYWVNNNFTAAARFYKENLKNVYLQKCEKVPVKIPTGVAVFPYEVLMFPKMLMRHQLQNIVSYNIMPRGGHFAALEEPHLLADDVFQFVSAVEKLNR